MSSETETICKQKYTDLLIEVESCGYNDNDEGSDDSTDDESVAFIFGRRCGFCFTWH